MALTSEDLQETVAVPPLLLWGDCLDMMASIPDGSVDAVICDLPYGTTACKWDAVIPFEPLWAHYKRVIKPNGAIVLFGSEPFSSLLRVSNLKQFKYDWVWEKSRATGHVHAKNKPTKKHEMISVFSKGTTVHDGQSLNRMGYYPQELVKLPEKKLRKVGGSADTVMGLRPSHKDTYQEFTNYPQSLLFFNSEGKPIHPTQKPVALLEYLIRTYTKEGETVLDNTMGSGSTGVACMNTGRNFIGIEKDAGYFDIAVRRIHDAGEFLSLVKGQEHDTDA